VLTDLDHIPVVVVVNPLDEAFMLEARIPGLRGGIGTPIVGGLELEDNSFVLESRESLFEDLSCGEGPDWGSLSLDRALRGGIGEGLDGHVAIMRNGGTGRSRANGSRLRWEAASWSGCRSAFPRRGGYR